MEGLARDLGLPLEELVGDLVDRTRGPCEQALFDAPHALAWGPDDALYVADIGNHRIRRIHDGAVTTVAGGGAEMGENVLATDAFMKDPFGIAFGPDGCLYVADTGGLRVCVFVPVEEAA